MTTAVAEHAKRELYNILTFLDNDYRHPALRCIFVISSYFLLIY